MQQICNTHYVYNEIYRKFYCLKSKQNLLKFNVNILNQRFYDSKNRKFWLFLQTHHFGQALPYRWARKQLNGTNLDSRHLARHPHTQLKYQNCHPRQLPMELFWPYLALASSSFTSATILPGTSEAAFILFVTNHPSAQIEALFIAGLFNGLGSVVSYFMGRYIPLRKRPSEKISNLLQRYGIWSLLFAWLPILGDGLPIAAGWLRLNAWKCSTILITGKFIRYAMLLAGLKFWM